MPVSQKFRDASGEMRLYIQEIREIIGHMDLLLNKLGLLAMCVPAEEKEKPKLDDPADDWPDEDKPLPEMPGWDY